MRYVSDRSSRSDQLRVLRRMSAEQRLVAALELSELTRTRFREGLRRRYLICRTASSRLFFASGLNYVAAGGPEAGDRPHICTLHDVGHQDGLGFLVMEYLKGETLAQRLTKGALPLDQALLDHIVRRCLVKDPDERWQAASDLMHEVKWVTQVGSQAVVPAPVIAGRKGFLGNTRLAWSIAIVSVVGFVAAFAIALLYFRVTPLEPQVAELQLLPPGKSNFARFAQNWLNPLSTLDS